MPSAAILAGGRATRFGGVDKSLLIVEGRSILSRQLTELSQMSDDLMIVGPARLPAAEAGHQVRAVADRVADCGPLAGVDAALTAARHAVVVIVACDMPFVTAAFLTYLVSLTSEADIVVPRTEDGYHPLCAAYTRACRPVISARLAQQRLAMVELFESVRVREVPQAEIDVFGGSRLLANVNTPAALDELGAFESHKA